jgi:hypothetical protein
MKTVYLGMTGDIRPEEMAAFVKVLEEYIGTIGPLGVLYGP